MHILNAHNERTYTHPALTSTTTHPHTRAHNDTYIHTHTSFLTCRRPIHAIVPIDEARDCTVGAHDRGRHGDFAVQDDEVLRGTVNAPQAVPHDVQTLRVHRKGHGLHVRGHVLVPAAQVRANELDTANRGGTCPMSAGPPLCGRVRVHVPAVTVTATVSVADAVTVSVAVAVAVAVSITVIVCMPSQPAASAVLASLLRRT